MMMNPEHPRWEEFCERLGGSEGCNFREENGRDKWDCGGGHDQSKAKTILAAMGFSEGDIHKSLDYFTKHGGHCDCEILFNVEECA